MDNTLKLEIWYIYRFLLSCENISGMSGYTLVGGLPFAPATSTYQLNNGAVSTMDSCNTGYEGTQFALSIGSDGNIWVPSFVGGHSATALTCTMFADKLVLGGSMTYIAAE